MNGTSGRARVEAIATATPYPWPYHGAFDPTRTALIACLDSSWRTIGAQSEESDRRVGQLAETLRELGGLVVAVTSTPSRRRLPQFSLASNGEKVQLPIAHDVRLESGGTSGFHASRLDDVLRREGRSDLMLAGWGLEGPVHSTMRAANDRGYECLLVPDASTPLENELAEPACSMVCFSGGIFGAVATTTDVLALLSGLRTDPLRAS